MKWNLAARFNERSRKVAVGFCLVLLLVAPVRGAEWRAESLPNYDQLFQQTNGWIGADGDFTVSLTNCFTVWLFSDTFVGEVRDGRRVHATMIHNSAAWQRGIDPASARVKFFYNKSTNGTPMSLIKPADGKGWFWLYDGMMIRGKLFLALTQIEHTDDKSVFGFRQIGTWLGKVSNPLAPPTQWRITQKKIPFAQFGPNESRSFGSTLLVSHGFVYIFGFHERKGMSRTMILARAPETDLEDFASWRFRSRDGWSTNVEAAADLCDGMATEYSVSWLPALRRFVLICTENGLSDKIMARTAPAPWGPWSTATVVYRCPERGWNKQIFCYAAKAHPMLASKPDELIITYAANSFSFSQVVNDARIYWPRFVLVKLN